jgi:hypothetical protein
MDEFVPYACFALGVFVGWYAHALVLQLAYRFGIVEYRGARNECEDKKKKGDAA